MATIPRNVRVPNRRWALAGLITKRRGEDRSALVNTSLERYNKRHATPAELEQVAAMFPDEVDEA